MKNVQISEELFISIACYHLLGHTDEEEFIRSGLENKLDAIKRHELYTQSKTAESEAERERARQDYLDEIGMRRSFRW